MVYSVAENFIRKRGFQKLIWLATMLNDGHSLTELADILKLTTGRVSQIVTHIFEKRFVFSPGAQDCVDFYLKNEKWHIDKESEEATPFRRDRLRLIPGVRHREVRQPESEDHPGD